VLLAYVDESYTKERYYLAAVLVSDQAAASLTKALDAVVSETAWAYPRQLLPSAELHAYDLVAGSHDWKNLRTELRVRIGVYQRALLAIASHDAKIILRGVDIVGLDARHPNGHDHPHSVVLNFLLEDIDRCAGSQDYALVIADEVAGQDSYRRELWNYQQAATWGYLSRKITRVLDTIHFAPSSASRLVQSADLVAYMHRRRATHVETDARAERAWAGMSASIAANIYANKCWFPSPR
jgi:Protein of unknown function (DUF3800)